jgi:hypothetical protein
MTTQQRLATWLASKNRDYKTGVQLFIDLNIDVKKIEFFSSGEEKIHRNILFRQLENYARIHKIRPQVFKEKAPVHQKRGKLKAQEMPKATKVQPGEKTERVLIDTNPSVKYDDLPANLKVLFKENSQMAGEMKALHAELKFIQDDPEKEERRKKLAEGIVERKEKSRVNWNEIDEWWKNRHQVKEPKKSPEELAAEEALKKDKRIKANLNYIRRYKNTTKKKQKEELEARKKELDAWGVSYEELLK